jgi:hypothetical protein
LLRLPCCCYRCCLVIWCWLLLLLFVDLRCCCCCIVPCCCYLRYEFAFVTIALVVDVCVVYLLVDVTLICWFSIVLVLLVVRCWFCWYLYCWLWNCWLLIVDCCWLLLICCIGIVVLWWCIRYLRYERYCRSRYVGITLPCYDSLRLLM